MMRIEVEKPAGNSGLIMVFDGLLDPSICSELLVKLQSVWGSAHEGKTLGGVDFTVKTTEDLHISEHAFNENNLTWDNKFYELEMAVTNSLSSAIAISVFVVRLVADCLNPHFLQPFPPALMLCNLGLTVLPHLSCVDFQGLS